MAIKYFDRNGTTAGFGTLSGSWNTTLAYWSDSSAGTSSTGSYTFTSADIAQFGASGAAATASTVNVSGANITLNGITTQNLSGLQTIARLGSNFITLTGTNPTINVDSSGGLRITAPISGGSGLIKTGSGPLILSASSNYSGSTVLKSGELRIATDTSLGNSTLVLSGGEFSSADTNSRSITNPITLAGDVILSDATNYGYIALNGAITLASNSTITHPSGAIQDYPIFGQINGTGFNLTTAGSGYGFRFLSSTPGNFNGILTLASSSTIEIGSWGAGGAPNQFASASAFNILAGTEMRINGNLAYTLNTQISGSGNLSVRTPGLTIPSASAYSGSFRIHSDPGIATSASAIFPTIPPLSEIYYLGTGSATLKYTGLTNGVLNMPLRFRPWSGGMTNIVHNASTNGSTLDITNDIYLWNDGNDATFQINVDNTAGLVNVSAPINHDPARILAIQKVGGGAAALSNANTHKGPTLLNSGTLELRNALAVQNSLVVLNTGSLIFSGSTAYTFGGIGGPGNLALTNSAGLPIDLTIKVANSDYSGIFSGNGNLLFTNSGSVNNNWYTTLVGGAGLNTGTVTVSGSVTNTDLALAYMNNGTPNQLSSASGIILQGTGRLFIQGNTAFTFNTPITGGPGRSVYVRNTNINGITFGNNLDSYSGSLHLYLDGNDVGLNQLTNVSSMPQGIVNFDSSVSSSLTLKYIGTSSATASGAFQLIPWGSASITGTLENASTNGSSITLNNPTAAVRHTQATRSALFRINVGASAGVINIATPISESSTGLLGLEKLGDGYAILGAANTFRNSTTLTTGTLELNNANALQNSALIITSGTLLFGTGSSTYNVPSINASRPVILKTLLDAPIDLNITGVANTGFSSSLDGSGSLVKRAGTATFFGQNTFSGSLTSTSSVIFVTGSSSFDSLGPVNLNGGSFVWLSTQPFNGSGRISLTGSSLIRMSGTTTRDIFVSSNVSGAVEATGQAGTTGSFNISGNLNFLGLGRLFSTNGYFINVQNLSMGSGTILVNHVFTGSGLVYDTGSIYPVLKYATASINPATVFTLQSSSTPPPHASASVRHNTSSKQIEMFFLPDVFNSQLTWRSTDLTWSTLTSSVGWSSGSYNTFWKNGDTATFNRASGSYSISVENNISASTAILFSGSNVPTYTISSSNASVITTPGLRLTGSRINLYTSNYLSGNIELATNARINIYNENAISGSGDISLQGGSSIRGFSSFSTNRNINIVGGGNPYINISTLTSSIGIVNSYYGIISGSALYFGYHPGYGILELHGANIYTANGNSLSFNPDYGESQPIFSTGSGNGLYVSASGIVRNVSGTSIPANSYLQLGGSIYETGETLVTRAYGSSVGTYQWFLGDGSTTGDSALGEAGGWSSYTPSGTVWTNAGATLTMGLDETAFDTRFVGVMMFGTSYASSRGKFTLSCPINLNGVDQKIFVSRGDPAYEQYSSSVAELSGLISDASNTGSIIKHGDGILKLSAKNTYRGDTSASYGELQVNFLGQQYGSGSNLTGSQKFVIQNGATLNYVGSGSNSVSASIHMQNPVSGVYKNKLENSGTAGFNIGGGLQIDSGSTVVFTGSSEALINTLGTISGSANIEISGAAWRVLDITTPNASVSVASGKFIMRNENGYFTNNLNLTVRAGATAEAVTGFSQTGKMRHKNLTLGSSGSAQKAIYKIGNGQESINNSSINVDTDLRFTATTNVILSSSDKYPVPGTYTLFRYGLWDGTGTLTGLHFLNVSSSIPGRPVSYFTHDPVAKRIYVTIS